MSVTTDHNTKRIVDSDGALNAVSITPDDNTDLTISVKALYIGGAGDLTVNMANTGTAILFKAVPAGSILPIRVKRVKAAGTGATFIVGLY